MSASDTAGSSCEPEHGDDFSGQTHWCRHLDRDGPCDNWLQNAVWVGKVGMTQLGHRGEMRLGPRLLEGSLSLEDLSG